MRWNMGQRLGVLLASFSLLASVLLGYLGFSAGRALLEQRASQTLLDTTRILAAHWQAGLNQVGQDVQALAELAAHQPAHAASQQQGLADAFAAVLRSHPDYLQARWIGRQGHGQELVHVRQWADARIERVVAPALLEKGHLPFVYETLPLVRGAVYVSDVGLNHEDAQDWRDPPMFYVAAPVVSPQGAATGVVVLRIDALAFLAQMRSGLPSDYQLFLANRWGDFLIHPDSTLALGFERGRRALVQEQFPATQALLQAGGRNALFAHTDAQGNPQSVAFVRMPHGGVDDGRFLLLGLAQAMAGVQADTQALGIATLRMVALLALLGALLAAWASRLFILPLRAVVQAAQAFSLGRAHGPLPVQRQDELGELARGFQDMEGIIGAQLQELNRSRDAMEHLAHHDALTGLPNRRMFTQCLQQAIERARRSGRPLALVFVDLDGFKAINDNLGHAVGDLVLQATAEAIRGAVRQSDIVARLAGDEFTVLCDNVDTPEAAQALLHKLAQAFAAPLAVGERTLPVRASMGLSLFPQDGQDADSLLGSADAAMYRAKSARVA